MTSSAAPAPSTEARRSLYLQQMLDHQRELKHLLDQQPEAGKVLADGLLRRIQHSFPGHPEPIALAAVSYREDIQMASDSQTQILISTDLPLRPLSALFTDKPWGGANLDAPNRHYRFYAKSTYSAATKAAFDRTHTINATTGGTSAFETFVGELIRHPDHYFQQQLEVFWRSPVSSGESMTRRLWLADRLARILLTEAALRVEDGTLEASCKTLIEHIVRQPSSAARDELPAHQRPSAFTLSIKGRSSKPDIPLIGLFVLASKTPEGDVLANSDAGAVALCAPDSGISAFASLHALEQSLQARSTQEETRERLLTCIAWQHQARARRYLKNAPTFSYVPVQDSIFENRVDALLTLQKQDIEFAWQQLPRHDADGKQVYELFNRLAHIGPFLDLRDRLNARSQRYLETLLPAWYREASPVDQEQLKQVATAELTANKHLASLMRKEAIAPLATFAREALTRQLTIDYPGNTIDPDKVQVTILTRLNPASVGGGIGADHVPNQHDPSTSPARTVTLTLTELALRNSNPWDFSFYKLFSGEHTSMSASIVDGAGKTVRLDHDYLTSLVQTLDVSEGYDRLLQKRLIDQGTHLRKAWTQAHQASLATQVKAARLDPDCLLKDREHRGYQWLMAVVEGDAPDNRRTVGGHRIVVSSLMIASSSGTRNGYVLNDAWIVSVANRRSVPNVILYTPSAPNGQSIKEFADISAMQLFLQQQWDASDEWRRYVMQRLTSPGQAFLTESRLARTLLLSELVLNSKSRVKNPFNTIHLSVITTSLHESLYEQQVVTLRRNADHASTSNAEVEDQSFWNKLYFGFDLALDLIGFLPITQTFKSARSITRTFLLLKQVGTSKVAARALWSMTGARLRPTVLRKIGAVPAFRPVPDLSQIEVKVDPPNLERLRGNLFQSKTSSQQYALINGKYYLSDVAQGQRYIYPPGTARKTLRYPLVLDESLKHWQAEPLPRLPGGMDPIEKGPLQTTFRDYELPTSDVDALPLLGQLPAGAMNLGYLNPTFTMNASSVGMLHIFGIQARLRRHARSFLRTFLSPSRPLTVPARGLLPEQLLQHLFIQRDGLVFGEKHIYSITRQFLIKNMPALKKVGVKALYLELFNTDLHQLYLDMYNASPTHVMPSVLSERLRVIDQMAFQHDPFSYRRLVEDAHAQGIRVMALDTTASSLYSSGDLAPPRVMPTLADQLDRVTMFNFFAYKRISAEQLARGPHRWVALVGQAHCNTLQSIPGLAELTNATGVRLERRIGNQMVARVSRDPGVVIYSPSGTNQFLHQCDLLVCLPSAGNGHELIQRVHSPKLFTTSTNATQHVNVQYMNDQYKVVSVQVFIDSTQAYVKHPPFGTVSERRFPDLDSLTEALIDELGMIEV